MGHQPLCARVGPRGRAAGAASALGSRAPGRGVRHFPWLRARTGIAERGRSDRLRRRLHYRDRASASVRHPDRRFAAMALRRHARPRLRRGHRLRRGILRLVPHRSRAVKRWIVTAGLGLWLAGIPGASEAHLVATRLGNFYDGAVHPLTGFEYALPWLALAILAALQGARSGRWLFLIFPLGLLAGGALSMLVPATGLGPLLNLLSIAGLGLLVALAV